MADVTGTTQGELDLGALLRALDPEQQPGHWVFVTVSEIPPGVTPAATCTEREGLSLLIGREEADRLGLAYDFVGAWITLTVHSALHAVGLTAAVAGELARAGLSCNVIAARHHDHLLVPHHQADEALAALERLAARGEPARPAGMPVQVARTTDLDAVTLYRILALRVSVFVVEQECPYPELDGRDLEPDARQLWIERDGAVVATLRLLTDPDGTARIGRVATTKTARSGGLAGQLMRHALDLATGRDIVLEAQSQLEGWYERFGFTRCGEEYPEDGIPHVPMRRHAGPARTPTGADQG